MKLYYLLLFSKLMKTNLSLAYLYSSAELPVHDNGIFEIYWWYKQRG